MRTEEAAVMKKRLRLLVSLSLTAFAFESRGTTVIGVSVPASAKEVTERLHGIDEAHDVPPPSARSQRKRSARTQQMLDSLGEAGPRHVDGPWIAIEPEKNRSGSCTRLWSGLKHFVGRLDSVSRTSVGSLVAKAKKGSILGTRAPAGSTRPSGNPLEIFPGEAAVRIAPSVVIVP
jgi:hypothetical protein